MGNHGDLDGAGMPLDQGSRKGLGMAHSRRVNGMERPEVLNGVPEKDMGELATQRARD